MSCKFSIRIRLNKTFCRWLKRCSSHVPGWFLFKVDPSTHFYELKIDVVKARQHLFSAINKQLTYILKNFWPTMPLGLVVSKASFRACNSVFPMLLYWNSRSVACFCFLRGKRGAWKWLITWKPRDRAKNRSFTSLLICNLCYHFRDKWILTNQNVGKSIDYSHLEIYTKITIICWQLPTDNYLLAITYWQLSVGNCLFTILCWQFT